MSITSTQAHTIIVGAGILGLAHAVLALDAGHRVTVIEQDTRAVGASVRNFGHVGSSLQTGELGVLAASARTIWLDIAARVGLTVRQSGTLALARTEAEAAVVDELHTTGVAESQWWDRAELERHGLRSGIAGVYLSDDLTADPRTTIARLAAWVDGQAHGEVRFSETVHSVDTGRVHTSRGVVRGDHIIVTVGHHLGRLFGEVAATSGIHECALQMVRVAAPTGVKDLPAVLTGTSMLRYPAFAVPAREALRAEIHATSPQLIDIGANVMFTQQADGTLLVGDSHAYDSTTAPFMNEGWTELLLAEAAQVLDVAQLHVLERWQGVYADSDHTDLVTTSPAPGVMAISVTTGVGMTIGFGLAARTISEL